jgi:hypothetical protein
VRARVRGFTTFEVRAVFGRSFVSSYVICGFDLNVGLHSSLVFWGFIRIFGYPQTATHGGESAVAAHVEGPEGHDDVHGVLICLRRRVLCHTDPGHGACHGVLICLRRRVLCHTDPGHGACRQPIHPSPRAANPAVDPCRYGATHAPPVRAGNETVQK